MKKMLGLLLVGVMMLGSASAFAQHTHTTGKLGRKFSVAALQTLFMIQDDPAGAEHTRRGFPGPVLQQVEYTHALATTSLENTIAASLNRLLLNVVMANMLYNSSMQTAADGATFDASQDTEKACVTQLYDRLHGDVGADLSKCNAATLGKAPGWLK